MKKEKEYKSNYKYAKKKTGKLFEFSCLAPAIIANRSLKEKIYSELRYRDRFIISNS